jgi:hypothetical protein
MGWACILIEAVLSLFFYRRADVAQKQNRRGKAVWFYLLAAVI